MYKIITDINIIHQLNHAVKTIEKNPDSQYCRIDFNADKTKLAIPITDYLYNKLELRELCPFLTEDFFCNLIETLPANWRWHYETPGRIIIPNYLILSEESLTRLIGCIKTSKIRHIITPDTTFVYLEEIFRKDKQTLDFFDNVKFEGEIKIVE